MSWPRAEAVQQIQVIRLSAMGDLVLCEPTIAGLAARYPQAQLSVVTRARWHALFRGHPAVAACLTLAQARALPPPDLAVDLHHRIDTARQTHRARHHKTWVKRGPLDLWHALWGRPMHRGYHDGPHQLDRIAAAMEGVALQRAPRLHLAAENHGALAAAQARGQVVLVPGASRAVKAWPVAHFARLARTLIQEGLNVAVLGGPGEAAAVQEVAGESGAKALDLDLDVAGLMAVLAQARLVVGNDSGPAHVAQALGVSTVVLFGPTAPGRWGPRAPNEALSLSPDCGPCSDHGARACAQPRRWCLDDLAPEVVAAAVRRRLAQPAEFHDGAALLPQQGH